MKQKILGFIASAFLWLIGSTYRYRYHFPDKETEDEFKKFIKAKKPDFDSSFILAFYHQDEMCLIPHYKFTGFSVLVSVSKDGEIMNTLAKNLGYHPVRGSSSKKAVSGLIAAIKKVKEGYHFAMAVDGPKGPIYKVKPGICAISDKTKRKIIPVRCTPKRTWIFEKAWNKAKLPKPFTRIDYYFGKFDFYNPNQLELELNKLVKI